MTQYHISDSGQVVKCQASPGHCPKKNFDSPQEAEDHLDKTIASHSLRKKKDSRMDELVKSYDTKNIYPHRLAVIDTPTEEAISVLSEVGQPLIVGGSVRDSLVKKESKDIDIEVHSVTMPTLISHLKKKGYAVDEVGRQFGVLKVNGRGVKDIDVSIPRKENKTGSGHRSFKASFDENMSLQEAAERRDFTFNAIMYDHRNQVIIDPTGGKKDLEDKVMRHVSDKFAEDPLRVLRGAQFATRFGMSYHPDTAQLCKRIRPSYSELSNERVVEEWGKFFEKGQNPRMGVKALQDSGWDDTEKGLKQSLSNPHTVESLERVVYQPKKYRILMGSSVIASNMPPPDRKSFAEASLPSKQDMQTSLALTSLDLSAMQTSYGRKNLARALHKQKVNFHLIDRYADVVASERLKDVAQQGIDDGLGDGPEQDLVMGRDILEVSQKKPGPWMSKLLDEIRDQQYKNGWKDKSIAMNYALDRMKQISEE